MNSPDQAPRIARVLDFETSGLPSDGDTARICEVGYTDVDLASLTVSDPVQFFVDPGVPIPASTRAVHHISDADVAGAIKGDEALERLHEGLGDADIWVAHNNRFERHFIGSAERGRQWVDTYRCAARAWPAHTPHGNQLLRYALDIDRLASFTPALAMPPHRAAPDSYVTAFIFLELLALRPLDRLLELSRMPALLPKLTFGKHFGVTYEEAPTGYLEWISREKDMDEDVQYTAGYWLRRRNPSAAPRDAITTEPRKPLIPHVVCAGNGCTEHAVMRSSRDGIPLCESCAANGNEGVCRAPIA